jgi:hypothetical protein
MAVVSGPKLLIKRFGMTRKLEEMDNVVWRGEQDSEKVSLS